MLNETVSEDEELRSYDVSTLLMSVPVDKALDISLEKLREDPTLHERTPLSPEDVTKLLELCLKNTYFVFEGQFYQQIHGASMGSPVSPIVCNLYMERVEERAIRTSNQNSQNPERSLHQTSE